MTHLVLKLLLYLTPVEPGSLLQHELPVWHCKHASDRYSHSCCLTATCQFLKCLQLSVGVCDSTVICFRAEDTAPDSAAVLQELAQGGTVLANLGTSLSSLSLSLSL